MPHAKLSDGCQADVSRSFSMREREIRAHSASWIGHDELMDRQPCVNLHNRPQLYAN